MFTFNLITFAPAEDLITSPQVICVAIKKFPPEKYYSDIIRMDFAHHKKL